MSLAQRLQQWTAGGILGFYNSCEVTVCCTLDRAGTAFNLFTIFSFESREYISDNPEFLTGKNEHISNCLNLAVAKYQLTITKALEACRRIEDGHNALTTPFGELKLSALLEVPPVFVPSDSTMIIPLNRILKNNFRGGSMMLEYFCKKDELHALADENSLKKAALRIRELLPIDLFTISDRTGNVIFQLPQQIASCRLSGSDNDVTCSIDLDPRVSEPERYQLTMYTDHDHAVMGFESAHLCEHSLVMSIPDTGGPYTIMLTDIKHRIPVLQQTTSMMRVASTVITFAGNEDTVRTIRLPDESEHNIVINSSELVFVERPELEWKKASQQRHYKKRMKELGQSREFIRYGKGADDSARALEDLRKLMNAGPNTRVYLWDPYLCATDLLQTWYFTDTFGLELWAISSIKACKKDPDSGGLESWRSEQQNILRAGSNQTGVNINWRIQHGKFGFSFHDRFLIRVNPREEPKAWSLGTSINSLGKTHHILQVVSNPGYVADAFEELWLMLKDESCRIWNSEEERK